MNPLALLHYELLLLFGILISVSFLGIPLNKKNITILFIFNCFVSFLQLVLFLLTDIDFVFKIYPFICHAPLIIFYMIYYKKSFLFSLYSVTCAYLFLQLSKWLAQALLFSIESNNLFFIIRIILLIVSAYLITHYLSPLISSLFEKSKQVIFIIFIPFIYYLFDYVFVIWNDSKSILVYEFLPFAMSLFYFAFCIIYFRDYEIKNEMEIKNQILEIQSSQSIKELKLFRENEFKLSLLRHDLRHYLQNILVNIENNELDKAISYIHQTIGKIDKTKVENFCGNEAINMILSFFKDEMEKNNIKLDLNIKISSTFVIPELEFSSILCNGLENAIHELIKLDKEKRVIQLLIKTENNKLLISIKNPYLTIPEFKNGLPISHEENHGYGCESIQHFTKKLNGNCQFSIEDNLFVLKVIL